MSKRSQEFDKKTFTTDHVYEVGNWSRYLDRTLPDMFKNSLDFENYKKMIDLSDQSQIQFLKNEEEKKLKINQDFMKQFTDLKISHELNGWSYNITEKIRTWRNDLAFMYLINYHFVYELKKRESRWSWYLIVISTICSTLTVLDIANIGVINFIKYIVTFLSVITSLIAAYTKKENYVERIKEMDRYIQKVGLVSMQIEGILQSKPWTRMHYDDFHKKYHNDIIQLFSSPPPMSPEEFKLTVYNLTVFNPELIFQQSPWYELRKIGDIEYHHMTDYGKEVIDSHINNLKRNLFSSFIYCFICCHIAYQSQFYKPIKVNEELIEGLIQDKKDKNKHRKSIIKENIDFDKYWNENFKEEEKTDIESQLPSF